MQEQDRESAATLSNELARERNREAADRTLLAWIRTSLAMISLGFGIERLGQAAVSLEGKVTGYSPIKTSVFGSTLIVLGIAATIAGMAPLAVMANKEMVNAAFETGRAQGVAFERRLFHGLFGSADQKEGMAAFVEKRQGKWTGK